MKVVRAGLVWFTALLMAAPTVAQTAYPDRPIRIIVGFTAGSATDITARMFAQKLNVAWNVPVTVENIPGAGGSVGGDRVAKAARTGLRRPRAQSRHSVVRQGSRSFAR
jgi:tripartite-type tricarboxylate transporter receptor subunit TctC